MKIAISMSEGNSTGESESDDDRQEIDDLVGQCLKVRK